MRRLLVGAPFLLLLLAPPALATFADAAGVSASHSTTQLVAPTGLTATASCSGGAPRVSLSWTATATTFATGYDVYRSVGLGSATLLASVTPRTTVTYTDTAVLGLSSYTYTVRTRYASWSKASASATATTPLTCL